QPPRHATQVRRCDQPRGGVFVLDAMRRRAQDRGSMTSPPQRAAGFRQVGFIGVGNQGAPIARRIIDRSGIPSMLWARRRSALDPFSDASAAMAADAAEPGAACALVCLCVWDDHAVEEVLLGPHGVFERMEPGGVVAIHSPVLPETILRIGAD